MFTLRPRFLSISARLPFLLPKPKLARLKAIGSLTLAFSTTPLLNMPPKKVATNGKRKASGSPVLVSSSSKKPKAINAVSETPDSGSSHTTNGSSDPLRRPHSTAQESEDNGIVLRKYYPHEMNNARCLAYNKDELPRPIELLNSALHETKAVKEKIEPGRCVVHWYKCDLRTRDNRSLHMAAEKAKSAGISLVCLYIISPQDFEAHLTAPVRVDFILRTLKTLQEDLAKLHIPLYVETVAKRKNVEGRIVQLLEEWGARHVYANAEYEVDELRREARLVRAMAEKGIAMDVVADTCVVAPASLMSGTGKQYSVYSPWYRAWITHVHGNPDLLDLFDAPSQNPDSAREEYKNLFACQIPEDVEGKTLSVEEKKRFRSMWPPGEENAHERLKKFCAHRIAGYQDNRNFPAKAMTSSLSVHFSSGTLSTRTAVAAARDANSTKKLDGGKSGIQTWISEVAWRDFYKHVMVHWPYVVMNKPFKPEYTNIAWEYNQEHFKAWTEGKTGYPIVDAAMRQLNHCGWMHNRCRMIVGSFLAKHLLLDWRMGERYFMEHLIDGDFASNNGGWGFSASTGVDPQPYFRIFNPLLQSEKFDKEGEFIRKWIPELAGVKGMAIHDPYDRKEGPTAKKAGYPERIVAHKESRERCLARYKEGLGRETA